MQLNADFLPDDLPGETPPPTDPPHHLDDDGDLPADTVPFQVLGYDRGSYFYLPAKAPQVRELTGPEWFESSYPPVEEQPVAKPDADGPFIYIDPKAPLATAKAFVGHRYTCQESRTLQLWQGDWREWDGASYLDLSSDDIRAGLYAFLSAARDHMTGELFKPTRHRVNDIADALKAVANLPTRVTPPCWLDGDDHPPATEMIACKNGLLHLPTQTLHPPTPSFFVLNALDFEFRPDAPPPAAWLEFLAQIWPDDPEAIAALQDIFGYLLTTDTTQQKIFLLVGPMRSGKGTIARILTAMIGPANVAGPTLASLAQPFGLATMIGKQVAIISDARLGGRVDQHAITERLLAVSGEDTLSIPRKYALDFTAKLAVRFLILTNELPRLADSSGALASRFVVLTMRRTFLGREDQGLTAKLLRELPGILNWSIEGWQRLQARGYFIQPRSSAESAQDLADLSSPILAFIRERCDVNPAAQVECGALYREWGDWCKNQGREHPGTLQTFGRDLRAALPGVSVTRPRQDGERVRVYSGIGLRSSVVRDPDHCTHKPEETWDRGEGLYSGEHNASDRGPSRPTFNDTVEVFL